MSEGALVLNLAAWIATYGYVAVALGTFLEGETVLLLAGFAAHQGYLDLADVILVAVLASLAGDQSYFLLGRWRGRGLLARFPSLQGKWERVERHIRRHQDLLMLGIRFLYGLRIAGPLLIGMSGIAWPKFLLLNLLGALLWAPLIAGLGYLSGQALEGLMGDVRHYEEGIFLGLLLLAALWHLAGRLRAGAGRRRKMSG